MTTRAGSILVLLLVPVICAAQAAQDLALLPGFRAEKVLDVNRATDCQGIAIDENGNLVVASLLWKLYEITPAGDVSTLARFAPLQGPNPFDVVIDQGKIYFTNDDALSDPGLYRLDQDGPVRVTPPGWILTYIDKDVSGDFYGLAVPADDRGSQHLVRLTYDYSDDSFDVETLSISTPPNMRGLVVRSPHIYLAITADGDGASESGYIEQRDMNGENPQPVVSNLNFPRDLVMDEDGKFYTSEFRMSLTEGHGVYNYWAVVKLSSDGDEWPPLAEQVLGPVYLGMSSDGVLYVSEFQNGLVFKIEPGGSRVNVNEDHGLAIPSGMGFDRFGRPYVSSFRRSRVYRIDPDARTFAPITDYLGLNNQTIATNAGGVMYVSSASPAAIYGINPDEYDAVWPLGDRWTRTLQFDSYGRLVITSRTDAGATYDESISTAGIFHLGPGEVTDYITGIRNIERGFLFDDEQNFYVKMGRSDGIVKVRIDEMPSDPPTDIRDEPLFVDLTSKSADIRYFDRNVLGQLLIPLNEPGEIVLAEPSGSWYDFASGFSWPGHVNFDPTGVMWVVDADNGIFRIIGAPFIVPSVVRRNQVLCDLIRDGVDNAGIATSLCAKLQNASSAAGKGNFGAAINEMEAFVHQAQALAGKAFAAEGGPYLTRMAESIVAALKLL